MLKRAFDIILSLFGIIIISPLILVISLLLLIDSKGGIFFIQERVGKNGKIFKLIKFRTMKVGSQRQSSLTIGGRDPRITRFGYYLRKYKMDELPQLINVIKGEMSIVGPRPELQKYVKLYNKDQLEVLKVRPGITDLASIKYRNESDLLSNSENPEKLYVSEIMPEKLKLNYEYISSRSFWSDLVIIFKTIAVIFK